MKTINYDILNNPSKFSIILICCSVYQKKDGTSPVMSGGMLEELVEKCPSLPSQIGKAVEQYGGCPAILSHIPNTPIPTKFATFPVTPSNLRAENPDDYVYNRLKGKFKKYSLLPGWALVPRSDMVEFSAIKLAEIIKYYKLETVALPYDLFTFDEEDQEHAERAINIIERVVTDALIIVKRPKENTQGTVQATASSQVYYEDEE